MGGNVSKSFNSFEDMGRKINVLGNSQPLNEFFEIIQAIKNKVVQFFMKINKQWWPLGRRYMYEYIKFLKTTPKGSGNQAGAYGPGYGPD